MSFLQSMTTSSRARCEAAHRQEPLVALKERALATPSPPALRPSAAGFDLIAECKLAAPSAGVLQSPADPEGDVRQRAARYAGAGAFSVSVLTEPDRFHGSLQHLQAAARDLAVPAMRKDFLVDPYQVWEARAAGAGGVLVLVRMVDDATVVAMIEAAVEAELFVLMEAFDAEDLRRIDLALSSWPDDGPPPLVGVNSRDLVTLQVDPSRMLALASRIPEGALPVAESGIRTPDDAQRAAEAGFQAALVGTALMQAADPSQLAKDLLSAGRSVTTAAATRH